MARLSPVLLSLCLLLPLAAYLRPAARPFCLFVLGDFGALPEDEVRVPGMRDSERRHVRVGVAMEEALRGMCRPTAVVATGDLLYPSGVVGEHDTHGLERVFDRFPAILKEPGVDWLATPGNHDCESHSLSAMRFPLFAKLQHGTYGVKDYPRFGVRIVLVDTCVLVCSRKRKVGEGNFRCADGLEKYLDMHAKWRQQMDWLVDVLRTTNRASFPRLFVVGHWPVFSFRGNGPTRELYEDLLPLLHEFGVNAYFSGHDHALQHVVQARYPGLHFLGSGAGGYNLHTKLKEEAEADVNGAGEAHAKFISDDDGGFIVVRADSLHSHTPSWTASFVHAVNGTVYRVEV